MQICGRIIVHSGNASPSSQWVFQHAKAAFFVPGRGAQKDLRHESGQFFEHIRIVSVARSKELAN
jgi:hypothetical protein